MSNLSPVKKNIAFAANEFYLKMISLLAPTSKYRINHFRRINKRVTGNLYRGRGEKEAERKLSLVKILS